MLGKSLEGLPLSVSDVLHIMQCPEWFKYTTKQLPVTPLALEKLLPSEVPCLFFLSFMFSPSFPMVVYNFAPISCLGSWFIFSIEFISKCWLVKKEMFMMETSMGTLLSFYFRLKLNENPRK